MVEQGSGWQMSEAVRVLESGENCPELPIVEGKGFARLLLWPGNGGKFRSLYLIQLEDGAATILLRHASDCVYYVIEGEGSIVDGGTAEAEMLAEGSMMHIDAGDRYRLETPAGGVIRLVGGPCPADPALYESFGRR